MAFATKLGSSHGARRLALASFRITEARPQLRDADRAFST
jgi:hypothetical protein